MNNGAKIRSEICSTRISQIIQEASDTIYNEVGVRVRLYVSGGVQDEHLRTMDEMAALLGGCGREWMGGGRYKTNVTIRYVIIAYLRTVCGVSIPSLAVLFKCHHSTIIYAVKVHNNMLYIADDYYLSFYNKVKKYFL